MRGKKAKEIRWLTNKLFPQLEKCKYANRQQSRATGKLSPGRLAPDCFRAQYQKLKSMYKNRHTLILSNFAHRPEKIGQSATL